MRAAAAAMACRGSVALATVSISVSRGCVQVHCAITGRDMIADIETVRRHLDSDKYQRLQRARTADFDSYLVSHVVREAMSVFATMLTTSSPVQWQPFIVDSKTHPGMMYCKLTRINLNRVRGLRLGGGVPKSATPRMTTPSSSPLTPQDPAEIERHMGGKRFKKLKQQHDDAEAEKARRAALRKDDADAIADRIGALSSDEDDEFDDDEVRLCCAVAVCGNLRSAC